MNATQSEPQTDNNLNRLPTLEIKRPLFALEVTDWNAFEKVSGYKPVDTLTMKNDKSTLLFFEHEPQFVVRPSNAFGYTDGVRVLGEGSRFVSTGTIAEHYTEVNNLPVAPAPEWVLANLNNPNMMTIEGVTHRNMKEYLDDDQAGDGKLFADMYRERVIFDKAAGKWFIWTGNYWEEDWKGDVWNMVGNMVAAEYILASAEARKAGDDDLSKKFYQRSRELKNKYRVTPVLEWAAKQDGMQLRGDEWDTNQMLLGVGNGVLDLTTGKFRTGSPHEYLQAHSPIEWKGIDEPAPNFEKAVLEIMGGDTEMDAFLRRLFGYGITGKDTEHVFPIPFGEGRNGKTMLFDVISHVLGKDLAYTTSAETLMETKNSDGQGAKPFLHALRGKRLVWVTESKEGQRLSTNMVKHITGGGELTVRTLHQEPITFVQTHKVFLMTNHKPHVPADDIAIWDRVLLIPFEQRFVDNPKEGEFKRNKDLSEILKLESSGILAWLVRGCMEWQKQGLNAPDKVKAASIAYREEEDTVGDFVDECLLIETGISSTVQQIYNCYKDWAKEGGVDPMSRKALGKRLRTRFGEPVKKAEGVVFEGVAVNMKKR